MRLTIKILQAAEPSVVVNDPPVLIYSNYQYYIIACPRYWFLLPYQKFDKKNSSTQYSSTVI